MLKGKFFFFFFLKNTPLKHRLQSILASLSVKITQYTCCNLIGWKLKGALHLRDQLLRMMLMTTVCCIPKKRMITLHIKLAPQQKMTFSELKEGEF